MKLKSATILTVFMVALGSEADAQIYDTNGDYVETFAGSGFSGYLDGTGQLTMFNNPNAVVADSNSNLFVWDSSNYRFRKITPGGIVTTFAGGSSANNYQGTGTNVTFGNSFNKLAIDPSNTIWAGSPSTSWLYKITSGAVVTYTNLSSILGNANGINGICSDSYGNIYLSSGSGNQIIRYATNKVASVFAGSGNSGSVNGNGIFTSFYQPAALAVDAANNIYVWDSGNYLIRRIDQNANVVTLAGHNGGNYANADGGGTNASFYATGISAMCADNAGNIYLACGSCVRKMNAATNVVTVAGSFTPPGYANGFTNSALFSGAGGICISGGAVFVADSVNERIREITFNPQLQTVSGANLGIGTFSGVTITGTVGRTYQIQSSPNMSTWTTLATVLLNSSPYLWFDQSPVSGNKYYRALLLP